jgi:uncharacterized protein
LKTVLLDTNFLLVPYQFKIDVFNRIEELLEQPHEFIVPSGVVGELENLGKGKGKEGAAARFGLKLIRHNKPKIVESEGNVDNWIVGHAVETGAIVATNDRKLRVKLKKNRVKVISLLSRSRVGVV